MYIKSITLPYIITAGHGYIKISYYDLKGFNIKLMNFLILVFIIQIMLVYILRKIVTLTS